LLCNQAAGNFFKQTILYVHKLLRAIDKNKLLSKLPASAVCGENESFVTPDKLLEAFKQYPGIVTNTYKLMDTCNMKWNFTKTRIKKFSAHPKKMTGYFWQSRRRTTLRFATEIIKCQKQE